MIYIDDKANKLLHKSQIKPETILLSMSGTIGDVAMAPNDTTYPINSNQDIAKIHTKGIVNSYYVYLFLLTKYGQNYLQREARGSVQQHVFLSQIEDFEIPELNTHTINIFEKVVLQSNACHDKSKFLYKSAENTLLNELKLVDFTPSYEGINIKSFSKSNNDSERWDAEYFQPKYDDYENAIKSYKKGFTFVSDEFKHVKSVSKKLNNSYKYIEIGNVNVGDGTNTYTVRTTAELPANAKYEVTQGDLLISKVRPNRGAVTIIGYDEPDLIVSGAFTVLRNKKDSVFSNQMLQVLLRTSLYRDWLLKFNVGTQYPVIKDEDVLNLPIPKLDSEIQSEISRHVLESYALKNKSEKLLDIAKRAVEIAIEEDEDTAEAYIKTECKALSVELKD